jgi:peptidoglycan hydrolase CwlO-like protein
MFSLQADEADERLTRSERDSLALCAEIEMLRRRSHEAHEKIAAQKDELSKIKTDLKQFKNRVNQQPPAPALDFDSLIVP